MDQPSLLSWHAETIASFKVRRAAAFAAKIDLRAADLKRIADTRVRLASEAMQENSDRAAAAASVSRSNWLLWPAQQASGTL